MDEAGSPTGPRRFAQSIWRTLACAITPSRTTYVPWYVLTEPSVCTATKRAVTVSSFTLSTINVSPAVVPGPG